MKSRFVYVTLVALMASGMVLAQSGTSPSTQDAQSGSAVTAAPQGQNVDGQSNSSAAKENGMPCQSSKAESNSGMPGAMSANQGAKGEGSETNQKTGEFSSYSDTDPGRVDAGRR